MRVMSRNLTERFTIEGSVTAFARGKAGRARQGLAGGDHLESAAHLARSRLFLRHIPLSQRRQPVRAQTVLRKARDVLGQRDGMRPGLALWNEAVGEAHAQRFGA